MKKVIFSLFFVIAALAVKAQTIIGKVDVDGVPQFTAAIADCKSELQKVTSSKGTFSTMKLQDITFSQMSKGQYCLTAYEKDAMGKVARGIRVECKQDDENNLIITPASKVETTTNRAFAKINTSMQ
ncbi:MAG TPA: hypothetical protein PKX84_06830 [Bacteroidia bacterium]|nr:hypothetical protein [Bacteroidia bacterium]